MSERELRDGVFFADVGEEEVRRAVERVIHESVFDAGVVVFGFTDCYESGTSDCFSRGVCVEFSQMPLLPAPVTLIKVGDSSCVDESKDRSSP